MTIAWSQILVTLLMAAVTFAIPSKRWRPRMLPLVGAVHLGLTLAALRRPPTTISGEWLVLDPVGRIVLLLVSVLFLFTSLYTVGYLRYRTERANRRFCSCLLALLSMMTLVVWSHHLGLMWVGVEASTLAAAPLIYFNRTPRSIEATWKYLLVCSVGIALALLGSFLLAYSSLHTGLEPSLLYEDLLRDAARLSTPWLRAALVLLLVGYGTKMGLAPMHTWKPDAYGEAPGVVGAVLAGGLTSCAFLAIVRVVHICRSAGEGAYADRLLMLMGFVSLAFAGSFIVGQRDFKRMLAYSSVEHMGILTLGMGIGGAATLGVLLHLLNNGLTKGVLFLSAGNIHRAFGDKTTGRVRGALRRLPFSGALFVMGFLAVTGSPPFGTFISELTILTAAFGERRYYAGGLLLGFLMLAFVGMGACTLAVVQGRPPAAARRTAYHDGVLTVAPIAALLALVLVLGVYIPVPLDRLLREAVTFLEVLP